MIHLPIVTALNTSTYVAIQLDTNQSGRTFKCCVSDGTACLIAIDSSGTGAFTTLANLYFTINNTEPKNGIICYAKASAGTPNFQVLVER